MEYESTAAADINAVEWWSSNELVMSYYPGGKLVVQPSYKGKVKFDINTFSLELMKLQEDDSGIYTGKITEKETICAVKYNLSVIGE